MKQGKTNKSEAMRYRTPEKDTPGAFFFHLTPDTHRPYKTPSHNSFESSPTEIS